MKLFLLGSETYWVNQNTIYPTQETRNNSLLSVILRDLDQKSVKHQIKVSTNKQEFFACLKLNLTNSISDFHQKMINFFGYARHELVPKDMV